MPSTIANAPLLPLAHALRSGQLDLLEYVDAALEHITRDESILQALVPEPGRRARLMREAAALQRRYPDPASRPALYGVLLGVKDLFYADGLPLRAGSQLPPEEFHGSEASSVSKLRAAGALLLAKTAMSEFAYFEPGPTRNPRNPLYSPGGSSSGSAAAVAAGYCPLALGTQTIGSVIRPAAFCGVVGFKASYGRIAADGLVPCAPSFDTPGFFLQDTDGLETVAALLCDAWRAAPGGAARAIPLLAVPQGPYLDKTSAEGRAAFEQHVSLLEQAGYRVRRVELLSDIDDIIRRHGLVYAAEMALVHAAWFAAYEPRYRPRTARLIHEGQAIAAAQLEAARAEVGALRAEVEAVMARQDIDCWICPAAPGPAPEGISTTGDPLMNLPWTHAGLPVVALPAGLSRNGLPLGLQVVGRYMADEQLVSWAGPIAGVCATSDGSSH